MHPLDGFRKSRHSTERVSGVPPPRLATGLVKVDYPGTNHLISVEMAFSRDDVLIMNRGLLANRICIPSGRNIGQMSLITSCTIANARLLVSMKLAPIDEFSLTSSFPFFPFPTMIDRECLMT